jgi:trans-2,3-dihydro-3-hydroxyanthranilate isomerase
MSRFACHWVDVFTTERFGGNPLAVFPEAQGLDPALMQRIAFELHLSETTFVLPTERADCDVRVRIFTPHAEIPMAGHPTVGTAFVLDRCDRVVFEEGVGPVPVERVKADDGTTLWRMTQPRPRFADGADPADVAAALGLARGDLDEALPIESVATGLPFLCIGLRSLDALARARTSVERWSPIEAQTNGAQPYLFVRTGPNALRARMFAPGHGIAEDPATGSAAGPLGAYALAHDLAERDAGGTVRLTIAQGVEMGRPSAIHVEVEGRGREVTSIRVAGASVAVASGWFEL